MQCNVMEKKKHLNSDSHVNKQEWVGIASYNISVIRLTQNQNKSKNSMVWSRSPKSVFCNISRLTISTICDATCANLLTVEREGYHTTYSMN